MKLPDATGQRAERRAANAQRGLDVRRHEQSARAAYGWPQPAQSSQPAKPAEPAREISRQAGALSKEFPAYTRGAGQP